MADEPESGLPRGLETFQSPFDEDTLEVFAYSEGSYVVKKKGEEDIEAVGCGILFTAKCDNKGGWKIVRLREPSEAELEKILESD